MKEKIMYEVFIVLLVGDCLLPFLLGSFYSEYSHKTMLLSALGNQSSPVHVVYRVWMGILGVGIVGMSFKIFQDFKGVSIHLSSFLWVTMICYGVFDCIVSCFFEMGESKEMITLAAKIHGLGSVIGSTHY